MMILGIDPGTNCGWAVINGGRRKASGVWNLKPGRHEGAGMRFVRLYGYLEQLHEAYAIEAIGYEEVARHRGVAAAHIYGAIVGVVQQVGEKHTIPYQGIPVGTIKKRATGKGNASKQQMVAAAVHQFGHLYEAGDDNEADGLWCAVVMTEMLGTRVLWTEAGS